MNTSNKPIHAIRCGNIQAACWLNRGELGEFYSTAISRVYFDNTTGQWGESHSFTEQQELIAAAHVAQEMCRWICQQKEERTAQEGTGLDVTQSDT